MPSILGNLIHSKPFYSYPLHWMFFIFIHIIIMLLAIIGPFFSPYFLIILVLVQLQWFLFDYDCILSKIEKQMHPQGLTLYGRITWHSVVFLWIIFIISGIYWIKK